MLKTGSSRSMNKQPPPYKHPSTAESPAARPTSHRLHHVNGPALQLHDCYWKRSQANGNHRSISLQAENSGASSRGSKQRIVPAQHNLKVLKHAAI